MRAQLSVVQGQGIPRNIELDAPSLAEARQHAIQSGYTVLSCRSVSGNAWLRPRSAPRGLDTSVFVEQLRDLLTSGLSVIEGLTALRRGSRGSALAAIERLEQRLKEGKTLSAAMAADTANFSELLVALVSASEMTSDLPQALTRFLEHQRRAAGVRHRLVSASVYPLLVMGVGVLVLLLLLFYVMPKFARIFEGMSGELPWSAQAMVTWSQLLREHAQWLLLGAVGLVGGAVLMLGSASGRSSLTRWAVTRAPLRDRLTTYQLSRWYRATGMLVSGGIALPRALKLADAVLTSNLKDKGRAVERAVHDGLSPAAAYVAAGMATPIAEQLLLAGERTGDLGSVLSRIAQYHESEVSRTLERAMRALEPVVMALVGLGVGIVVVLMYLPIFELASAVQ